MVHPNRLTFFFWKIILIGYVVAYPDKYEVQDADTNMKVNLLDLLNDYTDNEKEHRRDSIDVPVENWSGRWMPSRPDESTPPPKIFHKNMHVSTTPPPKIILKSNDNSDGWTGRWMPSRPGEPTPPPKIFHEEGNIQQHNDRIPMGVISHECDDGKTNLTVDWDQSATSYACYGQKIVPDSRIPAEAYCEVIPKHYRAMHRCMSETIEYDDDVPLFGTHRPIWPVYGEYKYVPKQRWLHNLEHGGVVMLYHPCANQLEVQKLKKLVKGCLRRHIITPYNLLDEDRPLALLTWGCRFSMSHVNKEIVTKFIKENALHAPENEIYRDGDFDDQLIDKAKIVSDEQDSILCSKLM